MTHAAKAVQIVGMNTLKEIAEDPLLSGRTLPTRLQVLAQRMARRGMAGRRQVIHRRVPTTNPKKARKPFFGMLRARLRNPKQGRNPRRKALFGFRRRTVQYVMIV